MEVQTWTVPREWEGDTCVCIGGGESLTDEQVNYAMIRHHWRTIGVNNAYQKAPWLDVLYAADHQWWSWHWEKVKGLPCRKVTVDKRAKQDWPDLLYLGPTDSESHGLDGFDPDPSRLRTGKNGGYQAIHLAAHFGAKRIILLGYDQKGGHWHEPHPGGQSDIFGMCARYWPTLAEAMKERNIDVINCTPNSALTAFPMANLEDVL